MSPNALLVGMAVLYLVAGASSAPLSGMETLKAGAGTSFEASLRGSGELRAATAGIRERMTAAGNEAEGQIPAERISFSVERVFNDEYRVSGDGIDLRARRSFGGPMYRTTYEVTGSFLGQDIPFAKPLTIYKETFGFITTLAIEGPGLYVAFERNANAYSKNDCDVRAALQESFKPELATVLSGLLASLEWPPSSAVEGPVAPGKAAAPVAYRFQSRLDSMFYVNGANVDVRFEKLPGRGPSYRGRGAAFGSTFGTEAIRVDYDFPILGKRGYWLKAGNIDMEARDIVFGGRSRLEFRGSVKESADFSVFIMGLMHYLASR